MVAWQKTRFTLTPSPGPTPEPAVVPAVCFSGQSTVEVFGRGLTNIASLELSDLVQSDLGVYSRVYSFGHRDTKALAEFLQIHATGISKPLEIS